MISILNPPELDIKSKVNYILKVIENYFSCSKIPSYIEISINPNFFLCIYILFSIRQRILHISEQKIIKKHYIH